MLLNEPLLFHLFYGYELLIHCLSEMDQSGQKAPTSNYKIKSPEGCLLYTMITTVNDAVIYS